MIVKLLTEHHLAFLSLIGCCRGSFESTHVNVAHCWKSHALTHFKLSECDDVSIINIIQVKFSCFLCRIVPYT